VAIASLPRCLEDWKNPSPPARAPSTRAARSLKLTAGAERGWNGSSSLVRIAVPRTKSGVLRAEAAFEERAR
jgi:hypothetical protein